MAKSTTSHKNIIHLINLDTYGLNILNIHNTLENFEKHGTLMSAVETTKLKLAELEKKYSILLPITRQRRGLINGLGTIIKTITGNLDANDAHDLNEQIRQIQENRIDLDNTFNNQAIINQKLTDRINNITRHINREQEEIGRFMNKNANKIKEIEDTIQEQQYLNQLNYNIDILANHLSEISEAIILAKLGITSKNLLSPLELSKIFRIANNQSMNIISEEHLYEILKLQAYYNASSIVLNIQIPILSKENYNMNHILLIPINQTKEIDTKPFIIINEQRIQYFDQVCPRIENTYICEESPYQEMTNQSPCIGKLMNGEEANCPLKDTGFKQNILEPENNHILLINMPKTLIKSSCRNKTFITEGTTLIQFKNCNVEVNGVLYEDKADEFWDQTYILQLPPANITSNSTTDVITLQKLKEENIQYRQVMLATQAKISSHQTFSYMIVFLVLTLITAILFGTRKKRTTNLFIRDENIATPTSQSLWASLYRKGGGVTT